MSGLSEIQGVLQISKMENVVRVKDALQANMKDKRYIDELSLDWDGRISNDVTVTESVAVDDILDKLQPRPNSQLKTVLSYKLSWCDISRLARRSFILESWIP